MIIQANYSDHHDELVGLSKESPFTRDFDCYWFSDKEYYSRGWIRVSIEHDHVISGFTCFRFKVKVPETKLYFMGVRPLFQRGGVGTQLLEDLKAISPHRRIILDVMKRNLPGQNFYQKYGFTPYGECLRGRGILLQLTW